METKKKKQFVVDMNLITIIEICIDYFYNAKKKKKEMTELSHIRLSYLFTALSLFLFR